MMKKQKRHVLRCLSGLVLLGGVSMAFAAETNFNYNAITVAVVGASLDEDFVVPIGAPADGVAVYDSVAGASVDATFQVLGNLFIGVGALQVSNSGLGTEIEQNEIGLSLGYVIPVGDATDVILSGDLVRVKAEVCNRFGCVNETGTGYVLSVGARHWLTESVEVNGSLSYDDVGDFGSSTAVEVGAAYWFTERSSARLRLGYSSDLTLAALAYRYAF
jgi:hypothetical protein